MPKKANFLGIACILIGAFLLYPALTYAQQYYIHFSGTQFIPGDESYNYQKVSTGEYLYHNDVSDGFYFAPVNFNKDSTGAFFIKSISVRYYDGYTDGYVYVALTRRNLFNGVSHTVASWSSGTSSTTSVVAVAHKSSNAGYKLVDTQKFSYHLYVYFYRAASGFCGGSLRIHQVRVHYGT